VIDLLPDASVSRSAAQRTMEWEPLVRIYESRLWRRSPLMGLTLGIGFDDEQSLILDAARLTGTETVLDLACGPGIYTRPLARCVRAGRVFGLDLSLPMLRHAARRAQEEDIGNVTFVRGTALRLPFPAEHFDLVNCCGALHLFPDVGRVLAEVARVLRPGGRFTVAAFRRSEGSAAALATAVRRRLLGLDAFSPRDLEARLVEAGLTGCTVHHARAAWLVVSALRPN
jgi:SAM-dependent methyltransferase